MSVPNYCFWSWTACSSHSANFCQRSWFWIASFLSSTVVYVSMTQLYLLCCVKDAQCTQWPIVQGRALSASAICFISLKCHTTVSLLCLIVAKSKSLGKRLSACIECQEKGHAVTCPRAMLKLWPCNSYQKLREGRCMHKICLSGCCLAQDADGQCEKPAFSYGM